MDKSLHDQFISQLISWLGCYSCFRAKFWTRDITSANRYLGTKKRYMRRKRWSTTKRRKHISLQVGGEYRFFSCIFCLYQSDF